MGRHGPDRFQPSAGQRRRARSRPRLVVLVGLLGLLAAACSGAPPTVASLGATTTTTTLGASSAARGGGGGPGNPGAFSACMRAHGVTNFPDPTVHGNQISIRVTPAITGSPHYQSAQAACAHYLPKLAKGTPPAITAAQQQDYLRAAACMRAHGFPQFPDPTFAHGGVHFTLPSTMNQNSPAVQHAITICQKLIPAGLPYSGGNGS